MKHIAMALCDTPPCCLFLGRGVRGEASRDIVTVILPHRQLQEASLACEVKALVEVVYAVLFAELPVHSKTVWRTAHQL